MTNFYNENQLVADVSTFYHNGIGHQKTYKKQITPDGNTEYTVWYKTWIMTPNFTKILLNPNNEILAYIDVQRVYAPVETAFKLWKWFGIQEFHPELIGDFSCSVIDDKRGVVWEHKTDKHLYILHSAAPSVSSRQDWYRVGTDPLNKGFIETNFGILDHSTYSYEYNTHPSAPTQRIENLTKGILISEGIIKPKLTFAQKIKQAFQRRK